MQFAVKRLSRVEVAARATKDRIAERVPRSNQHEFNAGTLRTSLGLGHDRIESTLSLIIYGADGQEPLMEEVEYTLYNAREGRPRAAEYRLYYKTNLVGEAAQEGDLFALFRPERRSTHLVGVIVRAGTTFEDELLKALAVSPEQALTRFVFRSDASVEPRGVEVIGQLSLLEEAAPVATEHPLLTDALVAGKVPEARKIMEAAHLTVMQQHLSDADDLLFQSLDEETKLYFAIEAAVKGKELHRMVERGGVSLSKIMRFSLSILQSRKSRRGQSLQYHFARLLEARDIPFTPQCGTERGETPDFVIPGKQHYSNAAFPPDLLRMVACKTTVRERWGQVLKEAERIPEKYLLTVDREMTPDVIEKMHASCLLVFVPRQVRVKAYSANPKVETVTSLVGRLKTAVDEARHRLLLS